MKCLHIQLQPMRSDGDVAAHVEALTAVASTHDPDAVIDIENGEDNGPYTNVNIYTNDVTSLWVALSDLIANATWAPATVVCSEGANGWHDYYLLHHFDKTEPLDTLPEA